MDPNKALSNLFTALARGEREDALDALEALEGWISKGGFMPQVLVEKPEVQGWHRARVWTGPPNEFEGQKVG